MFSTRHYPDLVELSTSGGERGQAVESLLELMRQFDTLTQSWKTNREYTWIYTPGLPTHLPALGLPAEGRAIIAQMVKTVHVILDNGGWPPEFPPLICTLLGEDNYLVSGKQVFTWNRLDHQRWAIVI